MFKNRKFETYFLEIKSLTFPAWWRYFFKIICESSWFNYKKPIIYITTFIPSNQSFGRKILFPYNNFPLKNRRDMTNILFGKYLPKNMFQVNFKCANCFTLSLSRLAIANKWMMSLHYDVITWNQIVKSFCRKWSGFVEKCIGLAITIYLILHLLSKLPIRSLPWWI